MTTVVGIRYPNVPLALLIADRQTTSSITPEKYVYGRKIQISKDGMYAFGHSGVKDENMYALADKMYHRKIDMEKVLKEGKFPELRELNIARLGEELVDPEKMSGFLVISRFNKTPELYTCWPLGKVEKREIEAIGSGSKSALEYYRSVQIMGEARNYLGMERQPNKDDLIRLGLEAVRYAQGRDIYSSGLDLIALTANETIDCREHLEEDFKKKIEAVQQKINLSV